MAFFVPALLAGASALGSYLSGRNKQKQDSTSTRDETSVTTPEYDPQLWEGRNTLLQAYLDRLKGGQGWMTGYTGQGLRQINQVGDVRSKALSNILSARGLGSSPVAANLMGGLDSQRLTQQLDFLNEVPLLQRQMEGEDMSGLAQFISSLPKGSRSTTTGTYTGNQASYGSQAGAVGSGMSNAIAAFIKAKELYG